MPRARVTRSSQINGANLISEDQRHNPVISAVPEERLEQSMLTAGPTTLEPFLCFVCAGLRGVPA